MLNSIIDIMLKVLIKLFYRLKKKSTCKKWTDTDIVNIVETKQKLLFELVEKLENLGVKIPKDVKEKIK